MQQTGAFRSSSAFITHLALRAQNKTSFCPMILKLTFKPTPHSPNSIITRQEASAGRGHDTSAHSSIDAAPLPTDGLRRHRRGAARRQSAPLSACLRRNGADAGRTTPRALDQTTPWASDQTTPRASTSNAPLHCGRFSSELKKWRCPIQVELWA